MNDRQYAELALVPLLMKDAVIVGFDRYSMPQDYDRLMIFLNRAILQVVEELSPAHQGKVIRRANRLCTDTVTPYKGTEVFGLVVFCFVQVLTETGYLEIGQTSPLWQACNLFIPALEELAQDEAMMQEAEAAVPKMLTALQGRGYFLMDQADDGGSDE